MQPPRPNHPRLGKVTNFDEERGLGSIRADDGSELSFHSKSLATQSHGIAQGARVVFSTAFGHLGRLEAVGITIVTLSAESAGWTGSTDSRQ
jgi:cold shock CspA family protein